MKRWLRLTVKLREAGLIPRYGVLSTFKDIPLRSWRTWRWKNGSGFQQTRLCIVVLADRISAKCRHESECTFLVLIFVFVVSFAKDKSSEGADRAR